LSAEKPLVIKKRGLLLDSLSYVHIGVTSLLLVAFILLVVIFALQPHGRIASSLPALRPNGAVSLDEEQGLQPPPGHGGKVP